MVLTTRMTLPAVIKRSCDCWGDKLCPLFSKSIFDRHPHALALVVVLCICFTWSYPIISIAVCACMLYRTHDNKDATWSVVTAGECQNVLRTMGAFASRAMSCGYQRQQQQGEDKRVYSDKSQPPCAQKPLPLSAEIQGMRLSALRNLATTHNVSNEQLAELKAPGEKLTRTADFAAILIRVLQDRGAL